MGVGYGALAMATNGLWWVDLVLDQLPEAAKIQLFARIEGTSKVEVGGLMISLLKEAKLNSLVKNLVSKRPLIETKARLERKHSIRMINSLEKKELIDTTVQQVVKILGKLEGE